MTHYNITINDELAEVVEQAMKRGYYANRSEFFRDLIRDKYVKEDYVIEELDPSDPDYQYIEKIEKEGGLEFVAIEELMEKYCQ